MGEYQVIDVYLVAQVPLCKESIVQKTTKTLKTQAHIYAANMQRYRASRWCKVVGLKWNPSRKIWCWNIPTLQENLKLSTSWLKTEAAQCFLSHAMSCMQQGGLFCLLSWHISCTFWVIEITAAYVTALTTAADWESFQAQARNSPAVGRNSTRWKHFYVTMLQSHSCKIWVDIM